MQWEIEKLIFIENWGINKFLDGIRNLYFSIMEVNSFIDSQHDANSSILDEFFLEKQTYIFRSQLQQKIVKMLKASAHFKLQNGWDEDILPFPHFILL